MPAFALTRMVGKGAFIRAMRAAGLAQYADVEYAPRTIAQPLKLTLHTHLTRLIETSGTAEAVESV